MDTQTNPITSHDIVLMPPTASGQSFYGWVLLKNSDEEAGYVYLEDVPVKPRLGSTRYVVTSLAIERLPILLDMLRNEQPLQVRYFDPTGDGSNPSVFIENRTSESADQGTLRLPPELAEEIASFRN